jgi:pyruvate dehydrogenase E1 component alpha subunit
MKRDPTPAFRAWLKETGALEESALATIDAKAEATVAEAMEFAASSPPPSPSVLLDNVFADRSSVPARSAQWRS